MDADEELQPPVCEFQKCRHCSRTFFPDRIEKHEVICQDLHERRQSGPRKAPLRHSGQSSTSESTPDLQSSSSYSSRGSSVGLVAGSGKESPGRSPSPSPSPVAEIHQPSSPKPRPPTSTVNGGALPSPRGDTRSRSPNITRAGSGAILERSRATSGYSSCPQESEAVGAMWFDLRADGAKGKAISSALASRLARPTLRPAAAAATGPGVPVPSPAPMAPPLPSPGRKTPLPPTKRTRALRSEGEVVEDSRSPAPRLPAKPFVERSPRAVKPHIVGSKPSLSSQASHLHGPVKSRSFDQHPSTQPTQMHTGEATTASVPCGIPKSLSAAPVVAVSLAGAMDLERARRRADTRTRDPQSAQAAPGTSTHAHQQRQEETFKDLQQQLEQLKASGPSLPRTLSPHPRSRSLART